LSIELKDIMKVIGHSREKELIKKYLDKNYLAYSFLFEGRDCIGKKAVALQTAKSFLCETEYNLGCGECQSCKLVENTILSIYEDKKDITTHPFIKIVSPENNKEIKIDQIRDIIQFLKLKSKTGKVVIIENAEKMNIEASNSLLKTLEEPPEKTLIILTTSNITKLLPTIVSRTLKVKFSLLTDEEVKEILKIKGAVKKNIDMDILVSLAEGSLCLPEKILKNQALFNYAKDFFNLLISKVNHIEGIIRLAELIDKLEYEDIKVILTILDRYIYRKTLKGKISTELYERFISESKLLDRAISKGVKKKLAFEGFYFKLVS